MNWNQHFKLNTCSKLWALLPIEYHRMRLLFKSLFHVFSILGARMSWAGKMSSEWYLYELRLRHILLGFKKNVNRATTQVMMKTGMLMILIILVYQVEMCISLHLIRSRWKDQWSRLRSRREVWCGRRETNVKFVWENLKLNQSQITQDGIRPWKERRINCKRRQKVTWTHYEVGMRWFQMGHDLIQLRSWWVD